MSDETSDATVDATDEETAEETPARPMPDNRLIAGLVEQFDDVRWEPSHGQDVVRVPVDGWLAFAEAAKEAGFVMLTDVTVVDWYRKRRTRFDVVANLVAMDPPTRLRLIAELDAEPGEIASLVPVWPGANFAEREAYDMFGIVFTDHPDLSRILMPDDWQGHPLRKDFAVGSVPVQFKESHKVK